MYAEFQFLLTPITKIRGLAGYKPFTMSILIIDTKNEAFFIIES
jgi:hypothetical protein